MTSQKSIPPSEMMKQNIAIMRKSSGFSVVIVCCSSKAQARYWQKRLEEGRGSLLQTNTIVLSVEEDWPGFTLLKFTHSIDQVDKAKGKLQFCVSLIWQPE